MQRIGACTNGDGNPVWIFKCKKVTMQQINLRIHRIIGANSLHGPSCCIGQVYYMVNFLDLNKIDVIILN